MLRGDKKIHRRQGEPEFSTHRKMVKSDKKSEKKYLKDLSDRSGPYTVRVKVIDKSRKQTSPKTKYQMITFEDEEGQQMKATLFNDDIEAYEKVIGSQNIYELSNAIVKPIPKKFLRPNAEIKYQMTFGARTVIQKVGTFEEAGEPDYLTIADVPRASGGDERFSIIGVPIYIQPTQSVRVGQSDEVQVRELVILDNSSGRSVLLSLWKDLTMDVGDKLEALLPTYPVVVFTALKPSSYKGFSLSTTICTMVGFESRGAQAAKLTKWASDNRDMLTRKTESICSARNPIKAERTITLAELKAKTVEDLWQEDRFWINILIPDFDINYGRAYYACSNCGKNSSCAKDVTFDCSECYEKEVKSIPKIGVTFEGTDDTGSMTFSAYTMDTEKILGITADELCAKDRDEQYRFFVKVKEELKTQKICLELGPTLAISISYVLKWGLKGASRVD